MTSTLSLLDPQTLSARKNLVGVLGCCLNPCRKACCLFDCDLEFSNTVVLGGIGCCKFLPNFLCCAEGIKSTSRNLAAPSTPHHLYLAGISAKYFKDYVSVSSLVRRKNTQVNREKSSLTIIMYSFPPGDCTDFGPARSTKHLSAGLTARVWGDRLDGLPDPFCLRATLRGIQLSLELHSNLIRRFAQQALVHMTVGAVEIVDVSGG